MDLYAGTPPRPARAPATGEGPLAHEARVFAEESYLDHLSDLHRSAWERASGARPERVPKRLLVALSHSLERAVMSGPVEPPTVVVALFQRLPFFDREREVYERMAAAGIEVVVAFTADGAHEAPRGVHTVLLHPDEPLTDEWSVVAVGPRAGAFLVATDQHHFDPKEREPEASRQFAGRWGYSRAQACAELARLRFALGDRLPPALRRTLDLLLAHAMPAGGDPASSAGTPGETWATASLYHMLDDLLTTGAGNRELREQLSDAQAAAAARTAASVDPESGLTAPDFLDRWATPTDATTLPIGLALFDVGELDTDAVRADPRASYHAAHHVAAALTQPLGPVDAAVRLSAREFLVVVPGASDRHLAAVCDQIGEQLELASHGYPDISLRARTATIVTGTRPLPVRDLQAALAHLHPDDPGPRDTGDTPAGDRIVVASTSLHAGRPRPVPRPPEPARRPAPPAVPPAVPLPRRTAQAALDALIAEGDDARR